MAGGDPFKKATPGQKLRIPAAAYNAFIDSALDFQRRQRDQRGHSRGRLGDESGLVLVYNDSGADLDRFSVATVSGIAISPADNLSEFQNGPILKVAAPVTGAPVAIVHEPIAAGAYGKALVSGVTPVQIDVIDVEHTRCTLIAGDTAKLQSSFAGELRVLWMTDATGTQWGVVSLASSGGGSGLPLVQLTARVDSTTYTGDLYGDGPDTIPSQTGMTIRVLGLGTDDALPVGTFFHATWETWETLGSGSGSGSGGVGTTSYLTLVLGVSRWH